MMTGLVSSGHYKRDMDTALGLLEQKKRLSNQASSKLFETKRNTPLKSTFVPPPLKFSIKECYANRDGNFCVVVNVKKWVK